MWDWHVMTSFYSCTAWYPQVLTPVLVRGAALIMHGEGLIWAPVGEVIPGIWEEPRVFSYLLSPDWGSWGGGWEVRYRNGPAGGKQTRWMGYFCLFQCSPEHVSSAVRPMRVEKRVRRRARSLTWSKDDRRARGGESTNTKAHSKVPLCGVLYRLIERERHGLHPSASAHFCQWTHHRQQMSPCYLIHLYILHARNIQHLVQSMYAFMHLVDDFIVLWGQVIIKYGM